MRQSEERKSHSEIAVDYIYINEEDRYRSWQVWLAKCSQVLSCCLNATSSHVCALKKEITHWNFEFLLLHLSYFCWLLPQMYWYGNPPFNLSVFWDTAGNRMCFISVSVHSCNFTRDISMDNCLFLKKCNWYTFYQVFSCSVTSACIAAICFAHLMSSYIHSILYCSYSLQFLFHAPNFKIVRVFATASVFTPSILFNLENVKTFKSFLLYIPIITRLIFIIFTLWYIQQKNDWSQWREVFHSMQFLHPDPPPLSLWLSTILIIISL